MGSLLSATTFSDFRLNDMFLKGRLRADETPMRDETGDDMCFENIHNRGPLLGPGLSSGVAKTTLG